MVLIILVAIFLFSQSQDRSHQKIEGETEKLLNQLPQGSMTVISTEWEEVHGKTVHFPDLARLSEIDVLSVFKKHEITHLLLTSADIYPYLSIYGDSVSFVKTDENLGVFRYASQNPEINTNMLTEENNQLSSIYLVVGEPLTQLTSIICEFLSEDQIQRLPPEEIFFNKQSFVNEGLTCPYVIFIDSTSDNPFNWTLVCVPQSLRDSIGIRFYLLDEPSESFVSFNSFYIGDKYVKLWEVK